MLCAHAIDNVREHLGVDVVRDAIANLRPELASYVIDNGSTNLPAQSTPRLLLRDEDFSDLAVAMRSLPVSGLRSWLPLESTYDKSTHCTGEIGRRLAPAEAERWAGKALEFSRTLCATPLSVTDGLISIEQWTSCIRRYKEALCDFQYLPRPQERFPTPSQPQDIEDSLGQLSVGQCDEATLGRMRQALVEHPDGSNAKADHLVKFAKVKRQVGRKALRILEEEGRYHGYRRPTPPRYRK
jgi:hypothetical protein